MPTLLDFSLRFAPGGVYFWPTFFIFFPKQTETFNRTPTIRTRLLSPNGKIALYWRFSGTTNDKIALCWRFAQLPPGAPLIRKYLIFLFRLLIFIDYIYSDFFSQQFE